MAETVRALVERGIPVMGHLGLTPQSVHALGGYRVQGRDASRRRPAARRRDGAGGGGRVRASCSSWCRPSWRSGSRRRSPSPPSASAPAPDCDGQVLVLHDMLGLNEGFTPKFLKRYAELGEAVRPGGPGLRRRGAGRPLSRRRSTASNDRAAARFAHDRARDHSRPAPLGPQPRARRAAASRLVPTMGYLHEGHLRLVDEARRRADAVVMSIFVNPLQFGPNEDLARYPRDLPRDRALAEARGVDALFVPTADAMYPTGLGDPRRARVPPADGGRARRGPGHFAGVLTVVAKLFHLVEPDVAVLRAEGHPAGGAHPADGARPRLADSSIVVVPDGARGRRARAQQPQRVPGPGAAPPGRRAERGAPGGARGLARRTSGAQRGSRRAMRRRLDAEPTVAVEYIAIAEPGRSRRSTWSRRTPSSRSPPGSVAPG